MNELAQDNPSRHRFELTVDGHTAFAEYRQISGGLEFYHTVVPEALGGKGVGTRLVTSVLDQMRARGVKIKPTCPFFKAFLGKHPEYGDLVID
tara:strand:+ start:20225 stop:20503 length:279 start_codon:yes stop_codon:yes gene_type:complete